MPAQAKQSRSAGTFGSQGDHKHGHAAAVYRQGADHVSTTAERSGSTASASKTSLNIPPSAIPHGWCTALYALQRDHAEQKMV